MKSCTPPHPACSCYSSDLLNILRAVESSVHSFEWATKRCRARVSPKSMSRLSALVSNIQADLGISDDMVVASPTVYRIVL